MHSRGMQSMDVEWKLATDGLTKDHAVAGRKEVLGALVACTRDSHTAMGRLSNLQQKQPSSTEPREARMHTR